MLVAVRSQSGSASFRADPFPSYYDNLTARSWPGLDEIEVGIQQESVIDAIGLARIQTDRPVNLTPQLAFYEFEEGSSGLQTENLC
jgi:hypothetical protein